MKMKRFLLAFALVATALAKSPTTVARCPSSGRGFTVDFARAHTMVKETEGTAYGWESKSLPLQSELVYVTGHSNLDKLKAFILKSMPAGSRVLEETSFHTGKLQGLQLEGLNENGVPFIFRLLAARGHGYVYGSTNYDTARNREFVNSFHLVPK